MIAMTTPILPPPLSNDVVDLGVSTKPKRFVFDAGSDIYVAPPSVPLDLLGKIGGLQAQLANLTTADTDAKERVLSVFDELLFEESAQLLRTRVSERTVGLAHIVAAINHLLEVYGQAPTTSLPGSSTPSGNEASGGTSTSGAPNEG